MGLLEALQSMGIDTPDDPGKQAALKQGLLSMGLGLMSANGNLGSAIGQSGLLGMQSYSQDLQRQRDNTMGDMEMQAKKLQLQQAQAAAQRQQQLQSLPDQFFKSPAQQALAQGGGPTVANAQAMGSMKPEFDNEGYGKALMQIDPQAGLQWMQNTAKQDTSTVYDSEGRQVTIDKRTGKPVVAGTPKLPEAVQSYQYAQQQGYKGSFEDWTIANKQAGAMNVSMGSPIPVTLKDGTQGFVQPANKPGMPPQLLRLEDGSLPAPQAKPKEEKPLTEQQGNAAAFMMKAQNALDNLKAVPTISTKDYYASKVPVAGNYAMSENGQRAMNAEKQFIAAVLRKESGAAISNGEYQEYGDQFFPRPGDSKEKLAQKAQNREVALKAFSVQAGDHGAREAEKAMSTLPNKSGALSSGPLSEARAAIAKGAPRDAVIKRLLAAGIDTKGL